MMTDDELDLRLRRWFADGPTGLSDDAIDGVAATIAGRPQRGAARWTPGRHAVGWLVAAVVVIATLIGLRLVTVPDVASPDVPPSPIPTDRVSTIPVTQDSTLLAGRWGTRESVPGKPDGAWELSLTDWAIVQKPALDGAADSYALWLRPVRVEGGVIRMDAQPGGPCAGVAATYAWTIEDEMTLRLAAEDDGCAERRAVLEGRGWVRQWAGTLEPGRTYATVAAPVTVAMTIPPGRPLDAASEPDWYTHLAIDPGSSRFVLVSVVRQLFVDACDIGQAYRLVEEMTAEDVADHLTALPPLEVIERASTTVDGRPAVRLRIRVALEAVRDCTLGVAGYWADPGNPVLVSTGGAQQGQQSIGGTTEEMLLVDVDGEVVAISAQAPTADFEVWLDTVGPMLTSARIIRP